MRKIIATLVTAFMLVGVSAVPSQAAPLDNPAFTMAGVYREETPECRTGKIYEKPKCFSIHVEAYKEYEKRDMPESRERTGSATMVLTQSQTGKKFKPTAYVNVTHFYGPAYVGASTGFKASELPNLKPPYNVFELETTVNLPRGSICDWQGWCEEAPAVKDTRFYRVTIDEDTFRSREIFKSTATQTAMKKATATAEESASYTGKASYKATETATYRYKGKTYKATASHTVTKTKEITKKAKATASASAIKTATKTAVSTKSAKDAKAQASSQASSQAAKDATSAATKAAKKAAEKKAGSEAKKKITKKVKSQAKADAKKKITKKVKAGAKKEAQKKALATAKKKAKK